MNTCSDAGRPRLRTCSHPSDCSSPWYPGTTGTPAPDMSALASDLSPAWLGQRKVGPERASTSGSPQCAAPWPVATPAQPSWERKAFASKVGHSTNACLHCGVLPTCPAELTHGKDGRGWWPNKCDAPLLAGSCRGSPGDGRQGVARGSLAAHRSSASPSRAGTAWREGQAKSRQPTCKPRVLGEEAVARVDGGGAAAFRHLSQQGGTGAFRMAAGCSHLWAGPTCRHAAALLQQQAAPTLLTQTRAWMHDAPVDAYARVRTTGPLNPQRHPTSRMLSPRRYDSRAAAGPMQYASSAIATCCSTCAQPGSAHRARPSAGTAPTGLRHKQAAQARHGNGHLRPRHSFGQTNLHLPSTMSQADKPTLECRSASLNTATVGMPSRLAVVSTRHAISPRLLTSSLEMAGRPDGPDATGWLLLYARSPAASSPPHWRVRRAAAAAAAAAAGTSPIVLWTGQLG